MLKDSIKPAVARPAQVDVALEGIRTRIISGQYERGARLPTEAQLQIEWGVSRPVVREAMKILASQGLVRIEQGRGTFVAERDNTPLSQQLEWALLRAHSNEDGNIDQWDALLDVRFALEIRAAERAASFATPGEIDSMQRSIAKIRGTPGDVTLCSEADLEFHGTLAEATRNPLYPTLLGSLNDLLRQYVELNHHGADNALMTANQHEAILEAIQNENPEQAADAMRDHLKASETDLELSRQKKRLPPTKK